MLTDANKKLQKSCQIFYCKKCDYASRNRYNYKKHLLTTKHKMLTNANKKLRKVARPYSCQFCGKGYIHRSSFSRHQRNCLVAEEELALPSDSTADISNNEVIIDLLKEVIKYNKHPKTIHNTQNISINMFLNEYCKDAMNISDFIDKIQPTLTDLIKTKELGYVGGISNILIKNLNQLPSIKRPIHCSDMKRLKFYVKDKNGWNKDTNQKVDSVIDSVTTKQIKMLQQWEAENPGYISDPELLHTWDLLVHNIMGGASDDDLEKNKKNIKKKVGEEITLKGAIAELEKS